MVPNDTPRCMLKNMTIPLVWSATIHHDACSSICDKLTNAVSGWSPSIWRPLQATWQSRSQSWSAAGAESRARWARWGATPRPPRALETWCAQVLWHVGGLPSASCARCISSAKLDMRSRSLSHGQQTRPKTQWCRRAMLLTVILPNNKYPFRPLRSYVVLNLLRAAERSLPDVPQIACW